LQLRNVNHRAATLQRGQNKNRESGQSRHQTDAVADTVRDLLAE